MNSHCLLDELAALRRLRDVLQGLRNEISEAAEADALWEAVNDLLEHLDLHYPRQGT